MEDNANLENEQEGLGKKRKQSDGDDLNSDAVKKIKNDAEIGTADTERENMEMAVVLAGFPATKLTQSQAEVLEAALVEKINPADSGEPVQFVASRFQDGVLTFTCANEGTKTWLKQTIPSLSPWDGAKLQIKPAGVVRGEKFILWLTSLMRRRTSVQILDLIEKQNRGISTKDWKLLERKDVDNKASLLLWLDENSVTKLKSQNLKFHLGLGRSTLRNPDAVPAQQAKLKAKSTKVIPPKKIVSSKPPHFIQARMRPHIAQQPRTFMFKGPIRPQPPIRSQPPQGPRFIRPSQSPSQGRKLASPNRVRPQIRKNSGPWSEGVRIVSKSARTQEPRVMVINRRQNHEADFAVPDRPPRLKRVIIPEPEGPAIILAEGVEPRGNGYVGGRLIASDAPQHREPVVIVVPDDSIQDRFGDRGPSRIRDRRSDDMPPPSRDFGRGDRYLESSREDIHDDTYMDSNRGFSNGRFSNSAHGPGRENYMSSGRDYAREERFMDLSRGPVRDDRFSDTGRGPGREDTFMDVGRGPVREGRFVDSGHGPVREDRFLDSGRGPVREDRFLDSGRGPVREDRFLDSGRGPVREDRLMDSGRGSVREGRFMDSGRGSVREDRFMDSGRGSVREDRFMDSGRGPVREDRFMDSGRGPVREDRFMDSGRGPVREDRYRDSGRGPGREDRYRDPGRGPVREDRSVNSGPPPLLGQRISAPEQMQEQRFRGSNRSDLHGTWVSVASLTQSRDLGAARPQSDISQSSIYSRRLI